MYRQNRQVDPETSPSYTQSPYRQHHDQQQHHQQQHHHHHHHLPDEPHPHPYQHRPPPPGAHDYSAPGMASSISLPPISSIGFNPHMATSTSPLNPHLPAPHMARTLPPLGPYYDSPALPHQPEFVTATRPMYHGLPPPVAYATGGRLPLPSSGEVSMGMIPNRPMPKVKEVKRRTKTGCMTCRKRRIKCDEGRPECRNCIKSKRACSGYEAAGGQSPSLTAGTTVVAAATTAQSITSSQNFPGADRAHHYQGPTPSSPADSSRASLSTGSPRESAEQYYQRNPDLYPPHSHQPHGMGISGPNQSSPFPPCESMMDVSRSFPQRKTIEDLCCVAGQRPPHAPPLPPDQTPNLESIQKVYDTAFAAGLDKFLETGPARWYATQGFNHLVSDRDLLGQFLLYLTIVSNNSSPLQSENALVASQEARVTWALLDMISRPAHDGNEEAEKIARRVKAVEALLTGEPSLVVRGSMSDFIHQEDGASDTNPEPALKQDISTTFEKQLNRRSEDFWRHIEKFAESPRQFPPYNRNQNPQDPSHPISQSRPILDGLENRDIIYSMMLLSTSNGQENDITSRPGTSQGNAAGGSGNAVSNNNTTTHQYQQQLALARRFLDNEANGKATSLVFQVIAGMAGRAFQYD